jgi:TolB-like protein/Flp pilus assembly protein TadD
MEGGSSKPASTPTGAVFLSYASQDAGAAQNIAEALRAGGIEVFLDQSELRGGDAWDQKIRQQIRECALFVPIISAATESRSEGYFRLEWRLAVERSFHFADDQAFLLPVVIDATVQSGARVPERFRERQWTCLPEGEASAEFIAHVRRLLAHARAPETGFVRPQASGAPPTSRSRRVGVIAAAVAIATLGAIAVSSWLHRSAPTVEKVHGAPSAAAAALPDRKSLAVLPFENLTGRAEDAYLADGLQEEVLNALALVRDLRIVSRTSVEEYRGARRNVEEIGTRLGVGTVLEGSVRRDSNKMRLTVQLIDTRSDRHLMAANYDRDLGNILGLQSEVAREVAAALAATLSQLERGELDHIGTNNGDAYRNYLKAEALLPRWYGGGDIDASSEALRLLEEAVHLDPEFADAYALQAHVNIWMYFSREQTVYGERARLAFERALAIDPGLAEARLARGLYELYVAKQPDRALADLEPLAQQRPNSPTVLQALALVLRRHGRMDEAIADFQHAWDLDPLNHVYDVGVLTTCLGLRRYPEALEWTRLHEVRHPDMPVTYVVRARIIAFTTHTLQPLEALLTRADLDDDQRKSIEAQLEVARGHYREAIALWEARTEPEAALRSEYVAFLYRAAGDVPAAERLFRTLERDLAASLRHEPPDRGTVLKRLALVQSMLGEHDAAIRTVEEARALSPESLDPVNGPSVSFYRSVVLARAGRSDEANAEIARLLHVPFATADDPFSDPDPIYVLLKDDPQFDALIHHPPRL